MISRPSPFRTVLSLLPLLAIVLVAAERSVRGQGTDGAIPDPITTAELGLYADRLGLSEQQRAAIDRMHERYSDEFRALRDGDIQQFLEDSRRMFTTFMFNPDTAEAERMLGQYTRLDAQVKMVDDRFFNEVQSVLTREQSQAIERVRQMRERLRYRAGVNRIVSFANPGVSVDVSAVVQGLNFPDDILRRIDSTVHDYEMQVTARLRRFNDATGKMMVGMVAAMEEMMGGVDVRQNPRQLMARFEELQEVMSDVARPALNEAWEVVQTNRRTVRSLIDILPQDQGRQLEYAFLRAAYPQVFEGLWSSMSRYEIALARHSENVPLRTRIEDLRDAMDTRHRPITEQMMDAWDAQRRVMPAMPMGRRGRPASGEGDDRMERLNERRARVNEQGTEALLAVLGLRSEEELTAGSDVAIAPPTAMSAPRGRRAPRATGARQFAASASFAEAIRPAAGADELFPAPIGREEFRWYADILELDAVDTAILEVVRSEYEAAFRSMESERIMPFVERQRSAWRTEAGGELRGPTDAQIEAAYRERAELLEQIIELDDSFFEDVRALLPADAPQRLEAARRARLRTIYNRPGDALVGMRRGGPLAAIGQGMRGGMGRGSGNLEDSVDLLRLLELTELSAGERSELRRRLRSYDEQLTEAMQQRYDVMVEVNRTAEQLAATALAAQRDGGRFDWAALMRGDAQRRIEAMAEQGTAARVRVVELNRSAVEGLDEATGVPELYLRAAYPAIYRDPDSAEGSLLAALELDSLSFDQREQISDLLLDFRGPYADISQRMVAQEAEASLDAAGDRMARWQRQQGQRSTMERLRFERSELSERTIRRLMAVLDESQRGELGLVNR